YAWRTRLELDRRDWENAGKPDDGLLVGRNLEIARGHRAAFAADVPEADKAFIELSAETLARRAEEQQRAERDQAEREIKHLQATTAAQRRSAFWLRTALVTSTIAVVLVS